MLRNKLGYTCIVNILFGDSKKSGQIIYPSWGNPICLGALYLTLFSSVLRSFYLAFFC
tara:strand:- start:432 stop:605 length:174 start_codon:yes stop_codon:yes gene_type:complete